MNVSKVHEKSPPNGCRDAISGGFDILVTALNPLKMQYIPKNSSTCYIFFYPPLVFRGIFSRVVILRERREVDHDAVKVVQLQVPQTLVDKLDCLEKSLDND